MYKFLCTVSLLLSVCCLSLDALTVLPSRRLSAAQAESSFERKAASRLPVRLPEFSPIDSHGIVAELLAARVKFSRIKQNYMLLQKLYMTQVEELHEELQELISVAPVAPIVPLIPRYMKIWPEYKHRETIQSFSSASHTTGSSSGRSAASTDSSDSNCTISSHGSRLLSPSSDSDDRS